MRQQGIDLEELDENTQIGARDPGGMKDGLRIDDLFLKITAVSARNGSAPEGWLWLCLLLLHCFFAWLLRVDVLGIGSPSSVPIQFLLAGGALLQVLLLGEALAAQLAFWCGVAGQGNCSRPLWALHNCQLPGFITVSSLCIVTEVYSVGVQSNMPCARRSAAFWSTWVYRMQLLLWVHLVETTIKSLASGTDLSLLLIFVIASLSFGRSSSRNPFGRIWMISLDWCWAFMGLVTVLVGAGLLFLGLKVGSSKVMFVGPLLLRASVISLELCWVKNRVTTVALVAGAYNAKDDLRDHTVLAAEWGKYSYFGEYEFKNQGRSV
ncbi:hypothetical protein K438DRAFT_1950024 [Mycena galopus ATCC 62051]|nr:hypothetical protein K438DRAFT_1950024 [Mycena galopus ATCC 62051]